VYLACSVFGVRKHWGAALMELGANDPSVVLPIEEILEACRDQKLLGVDARFNANSNPPLVLVDRRARPPAHFCHPMRHHPLSPVWICPTEKMRHFSKFTHAG
jgi:hypothetical protein